MTSKVFISYRSVDRSAAAKIAEGLRAEGFQVWWDAEIEREFHKEIARELEESSVALVLLSSAWSVRDKKGATTWSLGEFTVAENAGKALLIRIEAFERAALTPPMQALTDHDLVGWSGDRTDARWRKIVEICKRMAARKGEPAVSSPSNSLLDQGQGSPAASPVQPSPVNTSPSAIAVNADKVGQVIHGDHIGDSHFKFE